MAIYRNVNDWVIYANRKAERSVILDDPSLFSTYSSSCFIKINYLYFFFSWPGFSLAYCVHKDGYSMVLSSHLSFSHSYWSSVFCRDISRVRACKNIHQNLAPTDWFTVNSFAHKPSIQAEDRLLPFPPHNGCSCSSNDLFTAQWLTST